MTKKEWLNQKITINYEDPLSEFVESAKSSGEELTTDFIKECIMDFIDNNMTIQAYRGKEEEFVMDEIKLGDMVCAGW